MNPVSDLRGSGVLGLQQLAYFCATYTDRATAMRRRHWERRDRSETDGGARSGRTYPWAAVGINLTRMICELFDVLTRHGSPGARPGILHSHVRVSMLRRIPVLHRPLPDLVPSVLAAVVGRKLCGRAVQLQAMWLCRSANVLKSANVYIHSHVLVPELDRTKMRCLYITKCCC